MNKLRQSIFIFLISAPAVTAVIGAMVYVLYGLNKTGAYLTAGLSLVAIYFIIKKYLADFNNNANYNFKNIPKNEYLIFLGFCLLWLVSAWLLYKGRSDRPIITPWQVVSSWYFLTYGLGVISLFFLSRRSSKLLTPALILQTLLLFGTAIVVYRVGYGFDPFIHEAAISAIQKLGQIKPLTPYYLGQYSLVIVLNNLTTISTAFWAKILVPGLASLAMPLLLIRWLKYHHGAEKDWGLAAVAMLILPATIFIITTPQNLAYLFLVIVLLWPKPESDIKEKVVVWLAAIAALITQPLAGIPAVLIVVSDLFKNKKINKLAYPIMIVLMAISLPIAFYVFSTLDSSTSATLVWPNLKFLFNAWQNNLTLENWWLNFLYLFNNLWNFIILALAITGAYIIFKKHNKELIYRFAWPAIALVIGALISLTINFRYLIDYERADYPQRILIVAVLFSLPLIITAFREFAIILEKSSKLIMISFLLTIAVVATASLYLSYPRFDHYFNSHGYATSKADDLAVKWIEADAHNQPYIVLADQQVSAAALHEYGFSHYYKNIFYYPVPTGGLLYPNYLNFVNKPDLKDIKAARVLTGVSRVYFVLNSYWWEYQKVATEAAALADTTKDIGDGQIKIFVFKK